MFDIFFIPKFTLYFYINTFFIVMFILIIINVLLFFMTYRLGYCFKTKYYILNIGVFVTIWSLVFLYFLSLLAYLNVDFVNNPYLFLQNHSIYIDSQNYFDIIYIKYILLNIVNNSYAMHINASSLLFIILTTLLIPICLILNTYVNFQLFCIKFKKNVNLFLLNKKETTELLNVYYFNIEKKNLIVIINLLFLEFVSFVFFATSNLLIFYVMFESSMIPLYFMLGIFGSRINKIKASYYLFFFTSISSVFFLVALFFINFRYGTLNIDFLIEQQFLPSVEKVLWICFFIPLSVKIPIFPLHIWLPEAHVEASTEGSVLLAGLLLKLGLFGIIKILIPVFPSASIYFTPLIFLIGLLSIFLSSFAIFIYLDIKKIIAYSSIIHMNFALLGIFSNSIIGINGAIYLMFVHGIISSGLFILAGILYSRFNSRIVSYFQGLNQSLPILSFFFFFFILANAGIPGTGGFIAELLVIFGLFESNWFVAILSLVAPLACTCFSFILYVRIFFGVNNTGSFNLLYKHCNNKLCYDMLYLEFSLSIFLFILIVQTGLFPSIYLNKINSEYNLFF